MGTPPTRLGQIQNPNGFLRECVGGSRVALPRFPPVRSVFFRFVFVPIDCLPWTGQGGRQPQLQVPAVPRPIAGGSRRGLGTGFGMAPAGAAQGSLAKAAAPELPRVALPIGTHPERPHRHAPGRLPGRPAASTGEPCQTGPTQREASATCCRTAALTRHKLGVGSVHGPGQRRLVSLQLAPVLFQRPLRHPSGHEPQGVERHQGSARSQRL